MSWRMTESQLSALHADSFFFEGGQNQTSGKKHENPRLLTEKLNVKLCTHSADECDFDPGTILLSKVKQKREKKKSSAQVDAFHRQNKQRHPSHRSVQDSFLRTERSGGGRNTTLKILGRSC